MNLFETAVVPSRRGAAVASAPAPMPELGRDEVLFKLLQREPDSIEHLHDITHWSQDDMRRTLLQLVADGKVKCTERNGMKWYSVRDTWRARP